MTKKKTTPSKASPKSAKKSSAKTQTDGNSSDQYVVLARKYRPNSFEDLIGQEAMVKTLENAFKSERIAQAYMLTGVRGIGKTTTARILARALNFEINGETGGPTTDLTSEGVHCREIIESRHPDVLELDAASNTSVDNIREIIESVRYRPVSARYKVYIIDEVHMLSRGAFNALLKTLEEPPEHVKFIFATTEIRKVPVTVLSRCQRFDLRRVEIPVLVEHLKKIATNENTEITDDALHMIARSAEGSVRDGLSILDQAIAMGSGEMGSGTVDGETVSAMLGLADRSRIYDLLEMVLGGKVKESLDGVTGLYMDGAEPTQILGDLADAVHAATRIKTAGDDAAPDSLTTDDRTRMSALSQTLTVPALSRAWSMILKGMGEISDAPDPRVAVEMLLIRMAHMADLPAPDELIRRFNAQPGNGAGAGNAAPRPTNGNGERSAPRAQVEPQAGNAQNITDQRAQDDEPSGDPGWDQSFASDAPQIAEPPQPVVPAKLENFEDLVSFIDSRRDVKLLSDVENHIRPVNFENGHIEVNLTDMAPKNLVGRLGEKLKSWTGKRWVIVVSREEGAPTIRERKQAAFEKDYAEIKDHPAVLNAQEHFPGAEIKDIRKLDQAGDNNADNEVVDAKRDNRQQS